MAQPPAVVIIARHGARLDAADQNWHLSTPTPYDPPLTYAGWNQCRALGVRIASLLHAREQAINDATTEPPPPDGTTARDFAGGVAGSDGSRKRKRRRHKVVIHTSPFLRCLQTSVAISAGMAQYQPSTTASTKSRTPSSMHSASPRIRAMEGLSGMSSPTLMPIAEPKHDFMHELARKTLGEQHKRHKRSKLRVDAFLGEWLNPQYFDQITPPPPSALMVATAKGELIANEPLDVFTPSLSSKSSQGSLWGAGRNVSRESTLDDWSDVRDALPAPTPRRDRASSVNSANSADSGSGRRSPFRPGHVLQRETSTIGKQETTAYVPPVPQYAVSGSDHIPRGYMAHARNATVNVDYQWDSSRAPQDWGDGGEYGEEWSSMHKRFRRGLNHMVQWYSRHNIDDRAEDALGFDQADHHADADESDEQEDLVVVMVTHGAGSNALIGALTGQPVLLDVGMASLTMAVRRDDAPFNPHSPALSATSSNGSSVKDTPRHSPHPQPPAFTNGHSPDHPRKTSLDLGLNAIYEMKIVASSEHLRPGSDPSRTSTTSFASGSTRVASKDIAARPPFRGDSAHSAAGAPIMASWNLNEDSRRGSNTSSALGSIRRPSTSSASLPSSSTNIHRSSTLPTSGIDHDSAHLPVPPPAPPSRSAASTPGNPGLWTPPPAPGSAGLWTPPAARTPAESAIEVEEERKSLFSTLASNNPGRTSPGHDLVLDFSNSPPESRPTSSGGPTTLPPLALDDAVDPTHTSNANGASLSAVNSASSERDALADLPLPLPLPVVGAKVPSALTRGLSQKGLWGNKPRGDDIRRKFAEPKRRWTGVVE